MLENPEPKKINWKNVVIGVVTGSILIGLGILAYLFFQPKPEEIAPTTTPKTTTTSAKKDGTEDWKIYTNTKIGFSIKCIPESLIMEDESISFLEPPNNRLVGLFLKVSNEGFDSFGTNQKIEAFNFLRKAGKGQFTTVPTIFRNHYDSETELTKIENLNIDHYPAVKMLSDYAGYQGPPLPLNAGAPPPPSYNISVFINKKGVIWEIDSHSLSKSDREKRTPSFNLMLSTFKFLD